MSMLLPFASHIRWLVLAAVFPATLSAADLQIDHVHRYFMRRH
jgi:hypothetical protein